MGGGWSTPMVKPVNPSPRGVFDMAFHWIGRAFAALAMTSASAGFLWSILHFVAQIAREILELSWSMTAVVVAVLLATLAAATLATQQNTEQARSR